MNAIILLFFALAFGMEADDSTLKGSKVSVHISPRRRLHQALVVIGRALEKVSYLSLFGLIAYSFYATGITLWNVVSFFMPWVPILNQDWMRTRFNLNQHTARILALFLMIAIQFVFLLSENSLNFYYTLVDFAPTLATHMIVVSSSLFFPKKLADSMTLTMGMIFLTSWMMPRPEVLEMAHFSYFNRDELRPSMQPFDFAKFWIENCHADTLQKCDIPETTASKFGENIKIGEKGKEICLALHGQWVRYHGTRPNQQIQEMCERYHPFPLTKFKESLNVPKDTKECERFFKKTLGLKFHPDKCTRCSKEQKGFLERLIKYSDEYQNEMCPKHRNQKTNQ